MTTTGNRLRALWAVSLTLALSGCGGPPRTDLDIREDLPDSDDGLILTIADTGGGPTFIQVDPDSGGARVWALQDERGLMEGKESCVDGPSQARLWEPDDAIFFNGRLGCEAGPWLLEEDGRARTFKDLPDDLKDEDLRGALPSPDGGMIAFIYEHQDDDDEDVDDVALIDVADESWYQLSELPAGEIRAMDWSPEGDALAVLYWDQDEDDLAILRLDAVDGAVKAWLDRDQDAGLDLDPDQIRPRLKWSPDGGRVAFVHEEAPDSLQLLDVATGEVEERDVEVDADDATGGEPDEGGIQDFSWSPDGERMVLATGGRCFGRVTSAGREDRCTDLLYTLDMTDEDEEPELLSEVMQAQTLDLAWLR